GGQANTFCERLGHAPRAPGGRQTDRSPCHTEQPGGEGDGEWTHENKCDEEEDENTDGSELKQLASRDDDARAPDEYREKKSRERDQDRDRSEDREPDLLQRPTGTAPDLANGLTANERECALAKERCVQCVDEDVIAVELEDREDRKSTRLNSSHT